MAAELVWSDLEEIPSAPTGFVPPANMTVNWDLFRSLPNFDMKNGSVEDVSSVLVRATIPGVWHWIPVLNMPSSLAINHLDAFIRSHIYHLSIHKQPAWTDALVRKLGIALGVMRATATTYYRVTASDIIPGELGTPYLTAFRAPSGEVVYQIIDSHVPVANNPHRDVLTGALVFDAAEQTAIGELVKCGMGVVPMQGYSLMMTNHHYLSDVTSQSRKVFAVPEKAYWKTHALGTWFDDDLKDLQDACWHKSTHPVSMDYKMNRAMDENVRDMLVAAGAGACASRLPASETELRTASSYQSLMQTVAPMFELCGGSVDITPLKLMIDLVKSFKFRDEQNMNNPLVPAAWKNTVVDRASALKKLGSLLSANADTVAWCYGFYCAQSESQAMMSASGVADTLKTSFSLSKLRNQSHASYTNGYAAYSDYMAARNKQRMEGNYKAPDFRFK